MASKDKMREELDISTASAVLAVAIVLSIVLIAHFTIAFIRHRSEVLVSNSQAAARDMWDDTQDNPGPPIFLVLPKPKWRIPSATPHRLQWLNRRVWFYCNGGQAFGYIPAQALSSGPNAFMATWEKYDGGRADELDIKEFSHTYAMLANRYTDAIAPAIHGRLGRNLRRTIAELRTWFRAFATAQDVVSPSADGGVVADCDEVVSSVAPSLLDAVTRVRRCGHFGSGNVRSNWVRLHDGIASVCAPFPSDPVCQRRKGEAAYRKVLQLTARLHAFTTRLPYKAQLVFIRQLDWAVASTD